MKKLIIILLLLLSLIALAACQTTTGDESSTVSEADVSTPAESSDDTPSTPDAPSEDVSDDISTISEDYVDYFYEVQTYTNYYDVVKRVYTSSRKTDYTDYYGLADKDKNMLCICKYGAYFEPLRISEAVVENRFITKNGTDTVIVTEKGVILNGVVLKSLTFPAKLAETATYQNILYVRGVATLEDGKKVLITPDGVISDLYDEVTFVDNDYYICIAGSVQSKLTVCGEMIAQVNSEYTEHSVIAENRVLKYATSWDGVVYSVFDTAGKMILNGADYGIDTPDFECYTAYDWMIYDRNGVKEIYKGGKLISAYYKELQCIPDMPAVIASFDYAIFEGGEYKTGTLYCLIGENAQTLYTETFDSITFLDADMIQVTQNGVTNEYFISQLTPCTHPEEHLAVISSFAEPYATYSLCNLGGDYNDELIIVADKVYVYGYDNVMIACGTSLYADGTNIAFKSGDSTGYAYTVYGFDGSTVLYGFVIDGIGNAIYYKVDNPQFEYVACIDGVYYIKGDPSGAKLDIRGNSISYDEFTTAVGGMQAIMPIPVK